MIPPCLSVEEWQSRSDIWRLHAQSLEETLDQVYAELYDTLQELEECNLIGVMILEAILIIMMTG